MKIHVTQVGNCGRRTYHEIYDREKQLPYHYLSVKGILTHSTIEKCIKDTSDFSIEYPNLLDNRGDRNDSDKIPEKLYNASLPEVSKCMRNFQQWVDETDIGLEHMIPEETQEVAHRGHIITGTPDAYGLDDDVHRILDFKTGKAVLRDEYKQQVGAYEYLLKETGKIPFNAKVEATVIFLGEGDGPVERSVPNKMLIEGRDKWLKGLEEHIDLINKCSDDKDYRPQCEFGFMCGLCGWRHMCSGI